ncbi:DUF4232 domain-containing protein [Streptacidiphilus sp. P02-A3a]|uniref:DUF4232 domain-containing protein n=1 Tax=Streptacidiphilus sp. P02-A3a TaxID=2704468 RepID=UPI0015FC7AF9|nr:DUF4232 domain-containing protein [Streptacidiphilus sp. P02-A3a]QMU67171.1 DUF4232 domain-containing protein [Streptacidiphilus sp. P02-A3a]
MNTPTTARRRILPMALLAAATATLALTACGQASASAAAPGTAAVTAAHAVPAAPAAAVRSADSNADSAGYAYKHPCTEQQLRVKVSYDARLGTSKRLIAVTDTGSTACGLSYFPVVAIDNSATIHAEHGTAQTVQPKVPGGLGGAPYFPVYAGHTAYAVVDLDPSHSTVGASRVYNELSVIATDTLPNADTVNTKLVAEGGSGNPYVKAPFLGLYENTIASANASATPARR